MALFKLTAAAVKAANKPNSRLSDGGNLYLRISNSGVKSWGFLYSIGGGDGKRGRQHELGLGPLHTISLAEAREKAAALRKVILDGKDPARERIRASHARQKETVSFDEVAKEYIDARKTEWANPKHQDQWSNSIKTYASPVIGKHAVADIDLDLIVKVLLPIWAEKTETATRIRGRLERILDYAAVKGYRSGENPARWKGGLKEVLPSPNKIAVVQHLAALPYAEVGAFMEKLRGQAGDGARMLELAILCASRSVEVRGACWKEFDLDSKIWTIPAARMKMRREHRVPLSSSAMKMLKAMKAEAAAEKRELLPDSLLFRAYGKEGRMFSDAVMSSTLKRMGVGITQHGFRSTFRDWAADCTNFPREVCEVALAHKVAEGAEAAYWRSDVIDKRAPLMEAWARFCNTVKNEGAAEVVPFGKRSNTAA